MPSRPDAWPDSGLALFAELAGNPGRIGLAVGGSPGQHTLGPLADALKLDIVSVGRILTGPAKPATADTVRTLLREAQIIEDTDVLFSPEIGIDPLAWLRDSCKRHPVFMRWPGALGDGIATYSAPGRRDHYERRLADAVVLRPITQVFPDESPYRIERIP